jgi:hypothetical protein
MMGRTEERLRDATAALGQVVRQQDIPELRLLAVGSRPERARWTRPRRRRWLDGRGLIPVVAAISMLALIGSLTFVSRIVSRSDLPPRSGASSPPMPVTSGPPMAPSAGQPAFLVISVGGQGFVRATTTGQIVARIQPPVKDFSMVGVAAAPGDRIFYLAGEIPVHHAQLKIEFFKLVLGANGRPGPARQLPGAPLIQPLPVTSDGLVSISLAVSPDGQELAYASDNEFFGNSGPRTPTITIQNLATGQRRAWRLWPSAVTVFASLSWAVDGRLGFVATVGDAAVAGGAVVLHRHSQLNVLMVLNTTASGSNLMQDSRLVAAAAGQSGPVGGFLSETGRSAYVLIRTGPGVNKLVVIAVATGAVTRVLLSGPQAVQSDPLSIDGNNLLAPLNLRHLPRNSPYYLSGHYARFNVSTGRITPLPFPLYFRAAAPFPPVELGW